MLVGKDDEPFIGYFCLPDYRRYGSVNVHVILYITVAHKGHCGLYHNTFRIFATHFEIFTTHFEIFATHFEYSQHISNLRNTFRNFRNTFAPGPQVLAEKKERLRNSSSFLRRHVLFHVWTTTARKVCFLPEMWVGACRKCRPTEAATLTARKISCTCRGQHGWQIVLCIFLENT